MIVPEEVDYKFLSVWGDSKPHSYFEVVYLVTMYLDVKQAYTEKLLHRAVIDNNWLMRSGVGPTLKQDNIELTPKGDLYLRSMAIRRGGEERYYKYFNRGQESKGFSSYGMDKFAPIPGNLQKLHSSNGTS